MDKVQTIYDFKGEKLSTGIKITNLKNVFV